LGFSTPPQGIYTTPCEGTSLPGIKAPLCSALATYNCSLVASKPPGKAFGGICPLLA